MNCTQIIQDHPVIRYNPILQWIYKNTMLCGKFSNWNRTHLQIGTKGKLRLSVISNAFPFESNFNGIKIFCHNTRDQLIRVSSQILGNDAIVILIDLFRLKNTKINTFVRVFVATRQRIFSVYNCFLYHWLFVVTIIFFLQLS